MRMHQHLDVDEKLSASPQLYQKGCLVMSCALSQVLDYYNSRLGVISSAVSLFRPRSACDRLIVQSRSAGSHCTHKAKGGSGSWLRATLSEHGEETYRVAAASGPASRPRARMW